jgi:peroxiredoxin
MTLQDRLDAFKADFEAGKPPYKIPPSVIVTMHRATAELIASGQAERAKKAGDIAPSFTLNDAAELLSKGPLVLTFYRGVWCPYCNMELAAISPQTQPNSRKSARQNHLTFPILSNVKGEVAASIVQNSFPSSMGKNPT